MNPRDFVQEVSAVENAKFFETFKHYSGHIYDVFYRDVNTKRLERVVTLFWGHVYFGYCKGRVRFGFKK